MEIPDFLSHLQIYNGYPVPFMQAWFDGKPDFRAVDPAKIIQCVQEKLCAICGKRLGEKCCFIGGPLSKMNRLFTDPAMHKQCAEFASRTCPFVSGKEAGLQRQTNEPGDGESAGDGLDAAASNDVLVECLD